MALQVYPSGMRYSSTLILKVEPAMRARIAQLAQLEERTMGSVVRRLIAAALEEQQAKQAERSEAA